MGVMTNTITLRTEARGAARGSDAAASQRPVVLIAALLGAVVAIGVLTGWVQTAFPEVLPEAADSIGWGLAMVGAILV